jgi:predicted transposase YdaD
MGQHDHSYKLLFSHRRMVAQLLRDFVAEPWVEELDLSSLEKVPQSYVAGGPGPARESDLVWRLKMASGQPLYLYLLLELQSTPDRLMALRMLTYVGLLYEDLARRGETAPGGRLPPVLPMVLYNGLTPWRPARDVEQLVAAPPGALEAYRPRLTYLLLDVNRLPPETLAEVSGPVAALFRLERSRELEETAREIDRLAKELAGATGTASLARSFARWLRQVLLPRRLPEAELPAVERLEEFRPMLEQRVKEWTQPWWEDGRRKGREEGREEGREVGRQEGRQLGEASVLVRQLERRFGPLSRQVRARVGTAGEEELLRWADRVLTAATLDEVFAGE